MLSSAAAAPACSAESSVLWLREVALHSSMHSQASSTQEPSCAAWQGVQLSSMGVKYDCLTTGSQPNSSPLIATGSTCLLNTELLILKAG